MYRLLLLGGLVLAIGSLATGLVYSYQSSVETAFNRGHAAGVSEINLQVSRQWELEQAASAALIADANIQVTKLEQDRATLEAQYGKLNQALITKGASRRNCLDAGVVQLLNAIGTDQPGPVPRP